MRRRLSFQQGNAMNEVVVVDNTSENTKEYYFHSVWKGDENSSVYRLVPDEETALILIYYDRNQMRTVP